MHDDSILRSPHALLEQKSVEELLTGDGVRSEITELRRRMGSALPDADPVGVPFDELFLLRFIASFQTAEAAEPKLRSCVEWRMTNQAVQHAARANHAGDYAAVDALMPQLVGLKQLMSSKLHAKVTGLGGPVYNIRACLNDEKALVAYLKQNGFTMLRDFMLLQRETAFHICDTETRRTGKLVKMMTWYDMNGMSIALDRRLMSEMGAISKLSESLYPQLLQAVVILNAPSLVRGMLGVAKPFFTKRLLEKIHFCGNTQGNNLKPNAIYGCPVATRLMTIDAVPTYLGGTCNCPGGCVNRPNSQRQPLPPKGGDGWQTITVGGRTLVPVPFDLPAQMSLLLSARVQATSHAEVGISLWREDIRDTDASCGAQLQIACPAVLSSSTAAPMEIKVGPFQDRKAIELRLDNRKSFSKRTLCLRSDMLPATRNDVVRTPQQDSGLIGGDPLPTICSNSSATVQPQKAQDLGGEMSQSHCDDADDEDDEDDEFFDALDEFEAAVHGTPKQTTAAENSVKTFALSGNDSTVNQDNQRQRVARTHRKGKGKGTISCCGNV